jgi:outer membrane lipoprotein SlyB
LAQSRPVPSTPTEAPQAGTAPAQWSAPGGTTQAAICASCGVVESVATVKQKGKGTGLGVVAGGVIGGVAGHQVGGGKGKTAMTVLGAIGGGLAGNEVEKRVRSETVFDVHVRMENGGIRTFRRAHSMGVGTRVVVEGSTLRIARASRQGAASHTLRTAAPAGNSSN